MSGAAFWFVGGCFFVLGAACAAIVFAFVKHPDRVDQLADWMGPRSVPPVSQRCRDHLQQMEER